MAAPVAARAQSSREDFTTLDARLLDESGTAPRRLANRVDLRVKLGETVRLRLLNHLDQPATLHFQGVRGPNSMDGAAGLTQSPVAPGASFDYRFTPPDSGLFWYRASAMPQAAAQRAQGLWGLLIVDESSPPDVDADLPFVIDDWSGGDAATPGAGAGLIVNSSPAPAVIEQRPGSRARLRILNASNARLMAVVFVNARPLVLAIDGQPCDPFEPARATLPIGPGARFDVLLDLPGDPDMKPAIISRGGGLRADAGDEPDRVLATFDLKGETRAPREPFGGLPLNPLLPAQIKLQNARRLDLAIEGPKTGADKIWTFNGGAGAVGGKPLFVVPRNQPVTLGLVNKTSAPQSIHVHGHVMRRLHPLDDGWEPYWRDTAIIAPGQTARVAFVADNPGKWLIESAILDYAATGLSGWFQVG